VYEGPEFRELRSFIAVAEDCNFSRAAQRLHITQPSLSAQIKKLEQDLNVVLFERKHAGVCLTPSGHKLLGLARQLLSMRAHVLHHIVHGKPGADLPFRMGFSPWISHKMVHEAISGYKEMVPGADIQPSSTTSEQLCVQVAGSLLDGAIVNLPVRDRDLFVQPICTERLLVCMRADDSLAAFESVPKEIVGKRLKVMFERSLHPLLYDEIAGKLGKAGIEFHPTEFAAHPSEIQFLVSEGLGCGIMRGGIPLITGLVARPVAGVSLTIRTAFITQRSQQRAVIPLLAYRVAEACADRVIHGTNKKPAKPAENLPLFGEQMTG
jgi:DNA-binding transcriptional LysR family regulator